jgi:hypothetical protein
MTIDVLYEVSCDGCGDTHIESDYATKAEVWAEHKAAGWKKRGDIVWCSDCVAKGLYKMKYVDWHDNHPVPAPKPHSFD